MLIRPEVGKCVRKLTSCARPRLNRLETHLSAAASCSLLRSFLRLPSRLLPATSVPPTCSHCIYSQSRAVILAIPNHRTEHVSQTVDHPWKTSARRGKFSLRVSSVLSSSTHFTILLSPLETPSILQGTTTRSSHVPHVTEPSIDPQRYWLGGNDGCDSGQPLLAHRAPQGCRITPPRAGSGEHKQPQCHIRPAARRNCFGINTSHGLRALDFSMPRRQRHSCRHALLTFHHRAQLGHPELPPQATYGEM